jgi:azurin
LLKFSVEDITVKAGSKIKLVFNNNDDMLHNFMLTQTGAGNEVGDLALKLGIQGEKLNYVPKTPKVLAHTTVLQPGEIETIYFNAPGTPGVYPYICSYPGHYFIMKGVIRVVK